MKKKLTLGLTTLLVLILGITFWGVQHNQTKQSTARTSHSSLVSSSSQKKKSSSSASQSNKAQDSKKASSSQSAKEETKESTPAPNKEAALNIDSLLAGDYASLAGTWTDANGRTVVFSPQGQASVLGTPGSFLVTRDGKGEPVMTITYADGTSFALLLYPAGQAIPSRHFQAGSADPSDTSKNRLVSPATDIFDEGGSDQFKNQVLYKTSDDYSSLN